MTELSWPIEKIERYGSAEDHWAVFFRDIEACIVGSTDELAAAGIPAKPYPAPPVTITVTVGDRSETVELTDEQARSVTRLRESGYYHNSEFADAARIGAALRRLGVQP